MPFSSYIFGFDILQVEELVQLAMVLELFITPFMVIILLPIHSISFVVTILVFLLLGLVL